MGYRDQVMAAHAQAETLQTELSRMTQRAQRAEAERQALTVELERIRSGASREQQLRDDPHFTLAVVLLPIAGVLGLIYAVALRAIVFRGTFYGTFDPTPRGVHNFVAQLEGPEAWASLLLICGALLLAVLPAVAAIGLLRRRKWGWGIGTVTYLLWTLPCPPLGLYGLFALCRAPTMSAFFARAEACGGRAMIPAYD